MRLSILIFALPLVSSAQPPTPVMPTTIIVTATAIGAAPGAIVCRDMATVAEMFDWYSDHLESSLQDRLTNGQSKMVRPSIPDPDLKRFKCVLARPGMKLILDRRYIVPVVSFKLPDGKIVRGVTQANMLIESKEDLERDDAAWKAKMDKQLPKPSTEPPAATRTQ